MPLIVHSEIQGWGIFRALFNDEGSLQRIFLPGETSSHNSKISSEGKIDALTEDKYQQGFHKFLQDFFSCLSFPEIIFPLDMDKFTDFERRVLGSLRKIKPGQKITYAQLADNAGYKGAARAVGSVMSKNRFPLYYPCHRVIRTSGDIGNYGGRKAMKKKLLQHENIMKKSKGDICYKK